LTDGIGFYDFVNLRPGTYTISLTQPAGYQMRATNVGSQGGTAQPDVISAINLQAAVVGTNNNFGEVVPPVISASGSGLDLSKLWFLASVGTGQMSAS
jgi:hypothetical protein